MNECEWCGDCVPLVRFVVNPRVWNSSSVWVCVDCRDYYGGEL